MLNKSYLAIMEDSLVKKADILRQLQLLWMEQSDILDDENMMPDEFEANVDKKAGLIEKLSELDEGFDMLFERVKAELDSNREQYKEQIHHMQELIREITDRSVQIQATEARNKEKAKKQFSGIRSKIREVKQSGKAVSTYYQNMMKMNTAEPQFWDSKK